MTSFLRRSLTVDEALDTILASIGRLQPVAITLDDAQGLVLAGKIVATVDSRGIGNFRRIHDGKPVASNELLLRYRVRHNELKFATNAFFFEEGTAARYEQARYGELRVAPDGELLLTGLRGKDLRKL